jgi:hypothetical protein
MMMTNKEEGQINNSKRDLNRAKHQFPSSFSISDQQKFRKDLGGLQFTENYHEEFSKNLNRIRFF